MRYLVLDTDVASAFVKKRETPSMRHALSGLRPVVSFATVGELTKWTVVSKWGPQRVRDVTRFLDAAGHLPYDSEVAEYWGGIQGYASLRGRPRQENDAWIAACCITAGLPLATLNTKDFADFAEHEGLELVALS